MFSLSAASLQKRGIITIFMSQTHSSAPVRKLKNTSPTSHYKGRPIVNSFDKMTIVEALKAIVIMKNNDRDISKCQYIKIVT